MKPRIGIASNFDLDRDAYLCYAADVRAIARAGGLPLVLPYFAPADIPELLDSLAGLVFTGGGDFAPEHYGAKPHPEIRRVNPARDAFEVPLAKTALEREMPVLGICRGMQLLNVAHQPLPALWRAASCDRRDHRPACDHGHPGPHRIPRRRIPRRARPTANATLILRVAHPHRRCACQARHGPAWSRARSVSLGAARVQGNAPASRQPASMFCLPARPRSVSR